MKAQKLIFKDSQPFLAVESCDLVQQYESLNLLLMPCGVDPRRIKNTKFIGGPWLLSSNAVLFLVKKGVLDVTIKRRIEGYDNLISTTKFRAFDHFTEKGYWVAEEHNFGSDFALYSEKPKPGIHADYLVFTNPETRLLLFLRATQILKKKVKNRAHPFLIF